MKREYNYQAFTPEEVKKGLLNDLLNYLLEHNKKNNEQYYDIHITTDGYCSIVEWIDISYNNEYGEEGKFEFVNYDQVVMLERTFPDNHIELCYDEEDYQERLKEFLEKNPGWEKTSYGTWTNKIENEKLRDKLEEENNSWEHLFGDTNTCSDNNKDEKNNERLKRILDKLKEENKNKKDSQD